MEWKNLTCIKYQYWDRQGWALSFKLRYLIFTTNLKVGISPIFTDETLSLMRGSGNKGWPLFQNRSALKAHALSTKQSGQSLAYFYLDWWEL